MSWADIKAEARQKVHATFAVRCLYRETQSSEPTELHARVHNRVVVGGAMGAGYAQIVEGVSHIIFEKAELIAENVIPKRNAYVTFPDYGMQFRLDSVEPNTGPVTQKWAVSGT